MHLKNKTHSNGITIQQALNQATQLLQSDTARLDTDILLAHLLKKSRAYLYAWPEHTIDPECYQRFCERVNRRKRGEPVAYILGQQAFWSFSFKVTPDTLIPRPETELLVEHALALLPKDKPCRVVDLGTGSGCIAISLAKERPNWQLIAVDRYWNTLQAAQYNAQQLGVDNICFVQGDWCHALPEHYFDLIVSNPPYIRADDPHLNQDTLKYEPTHALISGQDGLQALRTIAYQAIHALADNGLLLLEFGYDQAHALRQQLQHYRYQQINAYTDLNGIVRAVSAYRPASEPGFDQLSGTHSH